MTLWIISLMLALAIGGYIMFCTTLGVSFFRAYRDDATKKIIRAKYALAKETHREAEASEEEILIDVLRTRPTFLGEDNQKLREIVRQYPNIGSLCDYIVKEEKRARIIRE